MIATSTSFPPKSKRSLAMTRWTFENFKGEAVKTQKFFFLKVCLVLQAEEELVVLVLVVVVLVLVVVLLVLLVLLLMAEILHQLIGSLSHYL